VEEVLRLRGEGVSFRAIEREMFEGNDVDGWWAFNTLKLAERLTEEEKEEEGPSAT
jgi:hypothetical protein